ncbi:SRPBCC family protein [Hoyosella altamirensis]|uniref:Uncharacterized protein YndB with AHSA1/START domain n=1 Tax=Hoyosella altamirensis TaxID=616997 RepID=A0A839RL64_9ACTN|nr:SRPBCC family protein [Hoyosella altamirensis]MBB3037117.1 uncharacterized protein YndB with AHSA1/START domain [Hoyosella altamirensis]
MIDVEDSTVIERPVGDVFSFIADQTNGPRWQDGLDEVMRITDGPIGVGTRHRAVRRFLGRRLGIDNEYTSFEPDREVTFTGGSASMTFEFTYRTAPSGSGTRVSGHMRMNQSGLLAAIDRITAWQLKREMKKNFADLKRLMEDGRPEE